MPNASTGTPGRRPRVLLSAHACEPHRGSEPGIGWESAVALARTHDVWVITDGRLHGAAVERELAARPVPGLHVVFHTQSALVDGLRRVFKSYGYNVSYYAWQLGAGRLARRLHAEVGFDAVQHLTFVRYWQPTFMWRLGVPLVWGPLGGGDATPPALRGTMSPAGRATERVRDLMRRAGERDPWVRAAARRSAVCVATSAVTAGRLRALGAARVEVATDCAVSDADLAAIDATPRTRAPGDPVRFVSVGRLVHWKAYHLALGAFAALVHGPHAACVAGATYEIVGDGPERRRLAARARALGVAGRVRLAGPLPRPEVLRRLVDADVMVHPALHETGGWAVLEAMAAGLPVVCVDAGGPGERVTPECGVKVPLGDAASTVAGLRDAMCRLGMDADARAAMGRAAAARVRRDFTWARKGEADAERLRRAIAGEFARTPEAVA